MQPTKMELICFIWRFTTRNGAWRKYLLDLGADPKLVPPKKRSKVWRQKLKLLDFDGDQSFSDRFELRKGWLRILQELGVLEAPNKEFIKRLMFVDRYDLKELNGSIIELLSESNLSRVKDLCGSCCNNDWIDIFASVIKKRVRPKVNFQEFCYAFEHGSLDFFRMICREDIEDIELMNKISTDSNVIKHMIENSLTE